MTPNTVRSARTDGPPDSIADHHAADLPRVSVLTTSYNHDRWLLDTVNSVSRQSYAPIEHIVVDDGSSDGSVDLLAGLTLPNLRWASTPHVGQAPALNEAFRMSAGEIIGWLSSDDAYYDTSVVAEVVRAFVRHPEVVLVYGHAVLVDERGLPLQAEWVPPVRVLGFELPMHILQPAAFVRRSALGDRLVDEDFDLAMDTELWLRLRDRGVFLRLDRILAAERHHAARKSHVREAAAIEEAHRLDLAYAPAGGRSAHRRGRRWGVAFRLAGLTLIPRVEARPTAFDGHLDSRLALIRRQAIVPRARMATTPTPDVPPRTG